MKTVQKNQSLMDLLQLLKKTSIEQDAPIWKRVASDLEKPTRQRRIINIGKLDKYCKDGEVIVVPGKVLGTGGLTKKLSVAAYSFSEEAHRTISAKGSALTIRELIHKNPKGDKIKIMG
jgi:large subunit ribosomal protein L18e